MVGQMPRGFVSREARLIAFQSTSLRPIGDALIDAPVAPRETDERVRQLGQAPRRDDEEPDERQVGVAIGARLPTDLNEPEDGSERDEVPEPSDGEPWTRARKPQNGDGDDGDE